MLAEQGFMVSDCSGTRSCFDVLGRRGDYVVVIKVLSNVEGFTLENAVELRRMASLINATALVVSSHMKSSELGEGVLYSRHNVSVVGIGTLESMLDDVRPDVYSIRGRYCLQVNPSLLGRVRRRMGLTQESLARELRVSKQSVYRYERSGRISVDVAERLVELFGEDLVLPQNVGSPRDSSESIPSDRQVSNLRKRVLDELHSIGFSTSSTNAPFDVVARERDSLFTVVSNDWRRLERKIELCSELSHILGFYSLCVSERRLDLEGTCVLKPSDLEGIGRPRELIKWLSE